MSEALDIWYKPESKELYMIAGWRQWADAGSVSSGLPEYLLQKANARPVGTIHPGGFYLFQIPGTHNLLRPVVKFDEGFPESLQAQRNDLYFSGNEQRGLVYFLGDEPHLDIERYVADFLEAAETLGVKRIIGLGGVYGEVPYNKERSIISTFSLPGLKEQVKALAVNFSDYQGGASIGSFICRRAADKGIEYVSFYALAPLYDFSNLAQVTHAIRIEKDYLAWYGIMQRINYMLKMDVDLSELEELSHRQVENLDKEVEELESASPQLGVREYFERLTKEFTETPFIPPDDFWDEKLSGLFKDFD